MTSGSWWRPCQYETFARPRRAHPHALDSMKLPHKQRASRHGESESRASNMLGAARDWRLLHRTRIPGLEFVAWSRFGRSGYGPRYTRHWDTVLGNTSRVSPTVHPEYYRSMVFITRYLGHVDSQGDLPFIQRIQKNDSWVNITSSAGPNLPLYI